MCGIFGIVSNEVSSVVQILLAGLQRLEYRGYDSAGVAVINDRGKIEVKKSRGKIAELYKVVGNDGISDSRVGIAHTRWATHGAPNVKNAHPIHTDKVVVAHNGIIENCCTLKKNLEEQGVVFHTDTDTEIIPNMLTIHLNQGLSPISALSQCLNRLHGSFALVLLFAEYPDSLFVAKRKLPLAVGYDCNSVFAASDTNAIGSFVEKISYLENDDIAVIRPGNVNIYNNGISVKRSVKSNSPKNFLISKSGYSSFMLKELLEQPYALRKTIDQFYEIHQNTIRRNKGLLSRLDHITIVGCGSSYFAGLVAKYWLENIAQVKVYLEISSEFRYNGVKFSKGSVGLFISQSGETADTMEALHHAKSQGQFIVSITNTLSSSIDRESNITLYTVAGPEISVASTKTFSTQLAVLACFATEVAKMKGICVEVKWNNSMLLTPQHIESVLTMDRIKYVAELVIKYNKIILIGRGSSYGVAMEGALKIRELTYINTIGIAAGEMKHGSIALIDPTVLVVAIVPYDNLFFKTLSNIQEIIARQGVVVAFSDRQGAPFLKEICKDVIELQDVNNVSSPIVYSVAMQLLAYFVAIKKGMNVDYPRNLAKSVTVE